MAAVRGRPGRGREERGRRRGTNLKAKWRGMIAGACGSRMSTLLEQAVTITFFFSTYELRSLSSGPFDLLEWLACAVVGCHNLLFSWLP